MRTFNQHSNHLYWTESDDDIYVQKLELKVSCIVVDGKNEFKVKVGDTLYRSTTTCEVFKKEKEVKHAKASKKEEKEENSSEVPLVR